MLEYGSVLVRDDEISRGYRYVLYKDRTKRVMSVRGTM